MKYHSYIEALLNEYNFLKKSDPNGKFEGFSLRNSKTISVANTVEVLLTLYNLFGREFYRNERLKTFNFKKIINFLEQKKDDITQNPDEEQSVKEIAYCGIGLYLLNERNPSQEIANHLLNNINVENAWGTTLKNTNSELFSTFLVNCLFHYLDMDKIESSFVIQLMNDSDEQGASFYSKKTPIANNVHSVEALVYILYIYKYFYNKSCDIDKVNIINKYYTDKLHDIVEPKNDSFQVHPTNNYTIFAFGLAAFLLTDSESAFYLKNSYYILCDKIKDNITNIEKNIPYLLEISRMIFCIRQYFDPFATPINYSCTAENSSNNLNNKIDTIYDKINNLDNIIKDKIDEGATNSMILFLLIILFFIISYYVTKGIIDLTFPETSESKDIFTVIAGFLVPTLLTITGIMKKIANFIINIYKWTQRKDK